ncbi:MAG: phosphate propanoyltransferase [Armatimonadetes bacterium]|nr:phosphate propanoyltransferase [Armatimonadota bacterium]
MDFQEESIKAIVKQVIEKIALKENLEDIPVSFSNRHIHLNYKDLELLFGANYNLTKQKDLSQPGQYAAEETISLVGPKGIIPKVRILGPPRNFTQVEISITDSYILGINPVIRDSGNLKETPGIAIVGPKGVLSLKEGVIVAKRHIHMKEEEAKIRNLKDKDSAQVKIKGERALIFEDVLIRVSPDFRLEMHLDLDEANAAGIKRGEKASIVKYI